MVPNETLSEQIICPFYNAHTRLSITCEGVVGETQRAVFNSISSQVAHTQTYCITWNHKNCPHYQAVIKKYK